MPVHSIFSEYCTKITELLFTYDYLIMKQILRHSHNEYIVKSVSIKESYNNITGKK